MKRVVRRMHDMPVSRRLNLLILPVLLVVTLVFGEVCIAIYRDVVTQQSEQELRLYTESTAAYIDNMLSDMMRLSNTIYSNQPLRSTLMQLHASENRVDIVETMRIYDEVIDPLFTAVANPMRYVPRLYLLETKLYADSSFVRYIDKFPPDLPLDEMLNSEFASVYWNVSQAAANDDFQRSRDKLLCLTRVVYAPNMQPIAVLNTEIYLSSLEAIVAKQLSDKQGGGYNWVLEDGQVVFYGGEINQGDLLASSLVSINESRLDVAYPAYLVTQQGERQRGVLMLAAFVMVCIASLLIYLVSRIALNRLSLVVKKFSRFDGMTFSPPMQGADEAAILDQTFTGMLERYRESVDQHYRLENELRSAEVRLLMSKINPHFLYNTLSAIRWSVVKDGNTEAAGAVDDLVTFYRAALGKGRDTSTLDSEVQMMRQYVSLYIFTYSKDIQLAVDVQDDCGMLMVQKFLLQPIVENAIVHGGSKERCRIDLRARRDGEALYIEVHNDGPPMPSETVERLNAYNAQGRDAACGAQDGGDSYGVYNVTTRIHILYGEGYGLYYSALEGEGTLARFILPLSVGLR